MIESSLQKEILLIASKLGHRLFRVNTGVGWVGQSARVTKNMMVQVYPGDVIIRNARPLHAGLTEGGSDLIGWSNTGKFVGIETKVQGNKTAKDRLEKQQSFIDAIRNSGGIAGMVETREEFISLFSS